MPFVRRKLIFGKNLESLAKEAARASCRSVRFWFRRKYNLPESDERYLAMTDEAMLTDYWAHYYYEKPDSEFESSTDNFEDEIAAMDAEFGVNEDDFEDISHG